ncbi:hypothetical protein N7474_009348 [Penicillium riverlandense]|uniref:uncharacterized protein n=1 Tax=Penicillium riverlandense TaxID=1903569 RepID=UPI002546B71E|nr:uncharacterized protein N7474_009348 [Penicillium riverlandense]KAJ5808079.1 hypothetical protein N7474_009348 [Penicillium riverlandense]
MEGDIHNDAYPSSSSLSLPAPGGSHSLDKRRLLLIYIHGFMGTEASFQELPAHIHDLLTGLLSESHVVYTRIYPRYKSHGELQTAVDQFSAWLSPHEADDLDVILLGHSLGGILAADVALLQSQPNGHPKHRILGLVNFDVPFLGLHPRVIPTGLMGSVPRKDVPAEDELAEEQESLGLDPAYKPVAPNPNFDPPFKNDVRLVDRGFFKGMMHFVNKNTDNLSKSIFNRLVSPVKFASCVNNYSELRRRYRRLMELEAAEYSPGRVRFVNYYTSSTGRRKPNTKPAKETEDLDQTKNTAIPSSQEFSETPSVSSETEPVASSTGNLTLEGQSPKSAASDSTLAAEPTLVAEDASSEKGLPPADNPSLASPTSIDQKEGQPLSESASLSTLSLSTLSLSPSEYATNADVSKQKLRKFILLPSHHWRRADNAHWTPVLMEDMDEVLAHQSMFIPNAKNYDYLVGDTVALIEQWVQTDLTRRLLQEDLD